MTAGAHSPRGAPPMPKRGAGRAPRFSLVPRPLMAACFWRAKAEHGEDAGSRNSSAISGTEDVARRRLAAARTGRSLVDAALGSVRVVPMLVAPLRCDLHAAQTEAADHHRDRRAQGHEDAVAQVDV